MAAWCYILRCRDGSYYTACTTNLESRIGKHHAGTCGGYTATRLPIELVWTGEFQAVHDAIDYERRLKRWSRVEKEALIARDWPALQAAARDYAHHRR